MPRSSASKSHVFELTGGALCLDFANTLEDRPRGALEHLFDYRDLLSFARQAGVLGRGEIAELGRESERHPGRAVAALERALSARERLYRVFSALARGAAPAGQDLAALNGDLAAALARLRIVPDGSRFQWGWEGGRGELDAVLWPIVRSAGELLTSDEASWIRECHGDPCSWLFVDRSRTRRRRWCDMKTCGNRDKARRFYRKRKESRRS